MEAKAQLKRIPKYVLSYPTEENITHPSRDFGEASQVARAKEAARPAGMISTDFTWTAGFTGESLFTPNLQCH